MKIRNYILLVIIGLLLFVPFLGKVHLFDWDEINFAESAREMLLSHDYNRVQINFRPFWEKPPLFIWLQALSMSVFGVNEFAARLPNALIGIATLLCIFYIGSKFKDQRFAWLWTLVYLGSFLPHFYFKSGIIDPLFNLFIFLGIVQFARLTSLRSYTTKKEILISATAGLFIGLAILTKGPVALLMALVTLLFFWMSNRFRPVMRFRNIIVFLIVAGLVSTIWFGVETIRNGPWYIVTFIQYQIRLLTTADSGHGGPFYYHFIVLLIGCFPASLFLFGSLKTDLSETFDFLNLRKWMWLLLIAVLIIFSIVKTKIVHYSSLAWFPLTFLAAYSIYYSLFLSKKRFYGLQAFLIMLFGLAFALVFISIPFVGSHATLLAPYVHDAFGREALKANVYWSGFESWIGIAYLLLIFFSGFMIMWKRLRRPGIILLFAGTALCIFFVSFLVVPKVEQYSQGAAIELYEHAVSEQAYADVVGFKSYAQYFYGRKQPADNSSPLFYDWAKKEKGFTKAEIDTLEPNHFSELFKDWLLKGPLDRPAYLVTKIQHKQEVMEGNPQLQLVGERNGFVFFRRNKERSH